MPTLTAEFVCHDYFVHVHRRLHIDDVIVTTLALLARQPNGTLHVFNLSQRAARQVMTSIIEHFNARGMSTHDVVQEGTMVICRPTPAVTLHAPLTLAPPLRVPQYTMVPAVQRRPPKMPRQAAVARAPRRHYKRQQRYHHHGHY
jgi:hypothetical protein